MPGDTLSEPAEAVEAQSPRGGAAVVAARLAFGALRVARRLC